MDTTASGYGNAPNRDSELGFLAPPQQAGELGRLGPYRVLRVLGRGGMGMVLLADDPALKRSVALKVMLPEIAACPVARERFLREAQAAAALEHDHVVPIFLVAEDRGVPFIAMPFLKGMSLDDYLRKKGRLSVPQVLRAGREAAKGLAAAHDRGLVHRDIKPANLWLDAAAGGRVRILDFGLARAVQEDKHLTQDGAVIGTPAYMSPEQAAGRPVGPPSDLFSLGAVLYQLCTGRRPFTGSTTFAVLTSLATETPPPVAEVNPEVPAPFAELVMRLLEKDPARRPGSAREVAEAIYAVERKRLLKKLERETAPGLSTLGVSHAVDLDAEDPNRESTEFAPGPPGGRRTGSRLPLAAVVAGVAVVAAAAGGVWLSRPEPPPADGEPPASARPQAAEQPKQPPKGGPQSDPRSSAGRAPAGPVTAAPLALFDGKTLDGWVTDQREAGQFGRVNEDAQSLPFEIAEADGAPVLRSKGTTTRTMMRTRTSHKDYHLHLEYKFPVGDPGKGQDVYMTVWFHTTDQVGLYVNPSTKQGQRMVMTRAGGSLRSLDVWQWSEGGWKEMARLAKDAQNNFCDLPDPPGTVRAADAWQSCDVYAVGNTVVFRFGAHDLYALTRVQDWEDDRAVPVEAGYIGIHARTPGVLFRGFQIRPIADAPAEIRSRISAVGK